MNKDKLFTWLLVAYICGNSIKMAKELSKNSDGKATDDSRNLQSIL